MTTHQKISKILCDARKYLEEHGWYQGDYFEGGDYSEGNRACALGAMQAAAGCEGAQFSDDSLNDWMAATNFLEKKVLAGNSVPGFNDHPDRTKEEVLDLLQRGSELACKLSQDEPPSP